MRALQVVSTDGPSALAINEVPVPVAGSGEVLVEVHAVGVSFPDLLLSRGQYQVRPPLPFTLGVDFAGYADGQRVAGVLSYGAAAEFAVAPADHVFALPDSVSFEEAVALPMNYLTAEFALGARAGLRAGETVLVHGASGGVGTACLQVAAALGARTIGVVSTDAKAAFATAAGAGATVPASGFKDAVLGLTSGRGVDVVLDVVGGSSFTDSLRCLAPLGRLLVVGFAAGEGIPEVRVNRLLLNNIDVRGVGWGAYAMARPGYMQAQWERLVPMISAGFVKPPVGHVYRFEEFGQALVDMDSRAALGKLVVRVRD